MTLGLDVVDLALDALHALRTDAVTQAAVRVRRNVALDRVPVIAVVPQLPAVAADRDDLAQRLHLRE